MKYLIAALMAITMVGSAMANGNHDKNHHDDDDPIVVVGPKGDQGDPGPAGPRGDRGEPDVSANEKTAVGVEGVVRLIDQRRFSVDLFDKYDIRQDRNHFLGLRLTYKLGKSYEERRIDELEATIELLKSVAHQPYKSPLLFPPHHDHP